MTLNDNTIGQFGFDLVHVTFVGTEVKGWTLKRYSREAIDFYRDPLDSIRQCAHGDGDVGADHVTSSERRVPSMGCGEQQAAGKREAENVCTM